MHQLLSILIIALLFSCNDPAKENTSSPDTASQQTSDTASTGKNPIPENPATDPIAVIRTHVENISTATLKKKQFSFTCDEKMTVDYFYRNDSIVNITVDFGTVGDVYAKEEYYYDKGQLVFVYEYVQGGPACEGCEKTNEYRSYISNNKVIRYLKDQANQPCKKCSFSNNDRHYRLLKAFGTVEVKTIFCK